jgi:hypothetical protein
MFAGGVHVFVLGCLEVAGFLPEAPESAIKIAVEQVGLPRRGGSGNLTSWLNRPRHGRGVEQGGANRMNPDRQEGHSSIFAGLCPLNF